MAITRDDVASLISEEFAGTIFENATQGSAALQAFPAYQMGTKLTHVPVVATLPDAYWVSDSGDPTDAKGVKQQSAVKWANRSLVAEEIAVIIPVHESTIDDATEDILANLAALGGQAIGKKLDLAVFFGDDKPTTWTSPDLLAASVAAGQTVQVSTGTEDLYGALLTAASEVADAGFDPTTTIAKNSLQFQLANLRGNDDHLVLAGGAFNGFGTTVWSRNGGWIPADATAFVVDPTRVRIGVRQDVTTRLLDQATLGTGDDAINLAERDMVGLRFVARYAYVLGDGATAAGENKSPVGAVLPAASSGGDNGGSTEP